MKKVFCKNILVIALICVRDTFLLKRKAEEKTNSLLEKLPAQTLENRKYLFKK